MKTKLLPSLVCILMLLIPLQSYAEEIEIKFGEIVSYEELHLNFYDVGDSRCPLDVTCGQEGRVWVRIQTSNQTHKMGGTLETGFPFTYITPYTITLIDVKPHPVSTEKPDYVAILEITKLSEPEEPEPFTLSDEQQQMIQEYCETGIRHPDMIGIPQCIKNEPGCGPGPIFVDGTCKVESIQVDTIGSDGSPLPFVGGLVLVFGIIGLVVYFVKRREEN